MMNNNICHPWWVHTVSHTSAERLAWCSCFWLTLTLVKFSIRLLRRNACKGLRVLTLFRFFGNFSVTSIRRCCKQYTERHEFLLSGHRWPEDVLPRLLSWFVLCRLFGEDCLKAGRCWEKPWVEGLAVYCQRSFSSCQFSSDFVTLHLFGLPVFGFWCLLVLYTSLMLLSRLFLRPGSFSGREPCATAAARCRRLGNGAPGHREGSLHCRWVCFFLLRSPDLPGPSQTFPGTTVSPHWKALPKTSEGCLASSAARYALHRLFVEKGWFVKGLQELDPSRGSLRYSTYIVPAACHWNSIIWLRLDDIRWHCQWEKAAGTYLGTLMLRWDRPSQHVLTSGHPARSSTSKREVSLWATPAVTRLPL